MINHTAVRLRALRLLRARHRWPWPRGRCVQGAVLVWWAVGAWTLWWSPTSLMAADIIVIRPARWSQSLEQWRRYRQDQGWTVAEIDVAATAESTRQRVMDYCQLHGSPRFVVLIGDARPLPEHPDDYVPTFYRRSTALVQFGGDDMLATDLPYGDFDGDETPDAAVGRIPADSSEQVARFLQRVIAYEQSHDYAPWRRNVHVVAGVGGFGALTDALIEGTTRQFLAQRIPAWSRLTLTHASPGSVFCPSPDRFPQCCVDRFNDGGSFWVYIGHGQVKSLDWIHAANQWWPILTEKHLPQLSAPHPPVAVFLACYTGAFDAAEDSLAESIVLHPGGAIAAIAASRVSGPYGLAMLSHGLLEAVYQRHLATLGEAMLHAKRSMLHLDGNTRGKETIGADTASTQDAGSTAPSEATTDSLQPQLQLIQGIAAALTPEGYDLHQELQEHAWQMHLIGDPCMALAYPQEVALKAPRVAAPGSTASLSAQLPPGRILVELAYRRRDARTDLSADSLDYSVPQDWSQFQNRYEQANLPHIVAVDQAWSGGRWEHALIVPDDLPRGKYDIRLFVQCDEKFCVGHAELTIRPLAQLNTSSAAP
ncbi:MAG: peptidase C25 [Pirellulaceae bacterium]|nr:MAG: peptidase C25 [Pirellulaceae bacterium]